MTTDPLKKKKKIKRVVSRKSTDLEATVTHESEPKPNNVKIQLHKRINKAFKTNALDLSQSTTKLHGFNFTAVPEDVFNNVDCGSLAQLWLTNNRISVLSTDIGRLKNLRVLGLGGNRLSVLPNELASLVKLEKLYLEKNFIKALPEEISRLIHLRDLRLDHNQLSYFPMQVTQLRNLRRLGLSHNMIQHIPTDIKNLTKLVELDLDHNRVGPKLPQEIRWLNQLERIGLECNCLESEPEFLHELYLTEIRLTGNRAPTNNTAADSSETNESQSIPVRFDGYLQLRKAKKIVNADGSSTRQVSAIEGHIESSRLMNIENALWDRDAENEALMVIRARVLRKPWRTENRILNDIKLR